MACFDSEQNMIKLRHCVKAGTVNTDSAIFKQRVDVANDSNVVFDGNCSYFISVDSIRVENSDHSLNGNSLNNIMLADVRDHTVAGKCLPNGVSGYWVRIFGQKLKYKLDISLWKNISESLSETSWKVRMKKHGTEQLMKVGEICVHLLNTGQEVVVKKRKRKKKGTTLSQNMIVVKDLHGSDHLPTFCSKEQYIQISTCLRESVENGKFDLFQEMYEKFSSGLSEESKNNIELKLFLLIEKSYFFAVQGNFPEAKKLLQYIVENVVSKSINKVFLLNRAYLCLSNTHSLEGNYGTAEECLNVLQVDRKHGIPYEDVGNFYLLRGIIFMNFGKCLPRLSNYLWNESKESFEKARVSLEKSLPSLFNQLCRLRLNMARLSMYEVCSQDNGLHCFDDTQEQISIVETYGMHKLSARIKCLLNIVKGELFYHQNKPDNGHELLEEVERMATELKFNEEMLLSNSIQQSWNETQYKEFLDSIEEKSTLQKCETLYVSDAYNADGSL